VRAPPRKATPRSGESWAAALARAREAWDVLTGGGVPVRCMGCGAAGASVVAGHAEMTHQPGCTGGPMISPAYSDLAAAAILDAALRLWADTARVTDGGG
jgi:hypothetical protein